MGAEGTGRNERPRSAVVAAVLSLLLPGLGQVYNGEARRGIHILLALVAIIAAAALGLMQAAIGVWVVALAMAALFLYAFGDAVFGAVKHRHAPRQAYNRWYVYAAAVALAFAGNALFSANRDSLIGARPFSTPTASMCPSLVIGDNFVADTQYYRSHAPAFGEVAVYRLAGLGGEPVEYVKRIVGLPGDRIALRGHRLYRNGAVVDEPYIEIRGVDDPLADTPETTVPDGMLFVLGDNRAHSVDSRVAGMHGLVPINNLVGRANAIYWPKDWSRFGLQLQSPYDTGSEVWQKAREKCDPDKAG